MEVERAEAASKAAAVRTINRAIARGSWQAALAFLERRFPEEWGRRAQPDSTVVRQRAERIAREIGGGVTADDVIAEAERIANGW